MNDEKSKSSMPPFTLYLKICPLKLYLERAVRPTRLQPCHPPVTNQEKYREKKVWVEFCDLNEKKKKMTNGNTLKAIVGPVAPPEALTNTLSPS